MTKTNGTQRCLETKEDLEEEGFSEELAFLESLENEKKFPVWKNPKRLEEEDSDFSLLFAVLAREISHGNYDEPLLICRKMGSEPLFSRLLLHLLKEERRKKIDPHLILSWLEIGDKLYCNGQISPKTYAILKLHYLCKNWKSKIESFSCGCIQKITVELFLGNNSMRLNEALHAVIRSALSDLHPTVRRLLNPTSPSQLDFFAYYIETLQELHSCRAIPELTASSAPPRIIQLVGLLCELRAEDVPEACSKINRLLAHLIQNQQGHELKTSPPLETVMRIKLIPKLFESLVSNEDVKLEGFGRREMVQRCVALVEKESYSFAQKSSVFFAPLQLLLFICQKWDVWKRSKSVIKSRITSMNLNSPQAPVLILYVISLISHIDSSLLEHFIEFLEQSYSSPSPEDLEVKRKILTTLEILETLENPSTRQFFRENRVKSRLLLATPIKHAELVYEYVADLTPSELNQFVSTNSSELSAEPLDLFRAVKELDYYISSDFVWQMALKEGGASEFVAKQLRVLVRNNEKSVLKLRTEQIFEELRGTEPTRELLLTFSKVLLILAPEEYCSLPANTWNQLIPVVVLGYCLYFDRNEQHVLKLFRSLSERVRGAENLEGARQEPGACMEQICDWLKARDISFFSKETFIKTLFKMFTEQGSNIGLQLRAVEMSSILFSRLALQLQKQGDSAKGNFCQLATIIEKHIQLSSPSNSLSVKVCERAIEGYSQMNERWNSIFTTSKVMKILAFAKGNTELLEVVMSRIRGNQILLSALRSGKKKEFSVYDV